MIISDSWHRRQAVAIASTLPDGIEDARIILQLTLELLEGFMSKDMLVKTATAACVPALQPLPASA